MSLPLSALSLLLTLSLPPSLLPSPSRAGTLAVGRAHFVDSFFSDMSRDPDVDLQFALEASIAFGTEGGEDQDDVNERYGKFVQDKWREQQAAPRGIAHGIRGGPADGHSIRSKRNVRNGAKVVPVLIFHLLLLSSGAIVAFILIRMS